MEFARGLHGCRCLAQGMGRRHSTTIVDSEVIQARNTPTKAIKALLSKGNP